MCVNTECWVKGHWCYAHLLWGARWLGFPHQEDIYHLLPGIKFQSSKQSVAQIPPADQRIISPPAGTQGCIWERVRTPKTFQAESVWWGEESCSGWEFPLVRHCLWWGQAAPWGEGSGEETLGSLLSMSLALVLLKRNLGSFVWGPRGADIVESSQWEGWCSLEAKINGEKNKSLLTITVVQEKFKLDASKTGYWIEAGWQNSNNESYF